MYTNFAKYGAPLVAIDHCVGGKQNRTGMIVNSYIYLDWILPSIPAFSYQQVMWGWVKTYGHVWGKIRIVQLFSYMNQLF